MEKKIKQLAIELNCDEEIAKLILEGMTKDAAEQKVLIRECQEEMA